MKPERVLIAPLHWGLGHATRCIPVIEKEIEWGNTVFISANGAQKALLQRRFPSTTFIDIPFIEITYPADGNMVRHFLKKGLPLILAVIKEHFVLRKVVQHYKLTKVISDSRFGLWNKHVFSVFISHQIEIQSPVFQWLINRINRWVMQRFDEVWIPDFETFPGLAGILSHAKKMPRNIRYIGPLSRFSKYNHIARASQELDALAIISGPEPQRTIYEAQITRHLSESGLKSIILKGLPQQSDTVELDHLVIKNHMEDEGFAQAIIEASTIYARSGYTTIMDLHALGALNKAVFSPTPGQTEQEYLAHLHQIR